MPFLVGIIGFPNAGKSTLFKTLTKREVRIEPRPFSTIKPNIGVISVPDKDFQSLVQTVKPIKKKAATIEFWDIAGLVKEAHKGEGLGNQFLGQIRNCSALVEVIRSFKNKQVAHIENSVDPNRDLEIINTELIMKDLETVNKALSRMETGSINKEARRKKELLKQIREGLEKGKKVSQLNLGESEELIKELQLFTQKPIVYLVNQGPENVSFKKQVSPLIKANLYTEMEILDLSPQERKEIGVKSVLPELIKTCHQALDLITFYTIKGGQEARASVLKKDGTALEAAGKIHSDFQEKFIRAEVINCKELIELGGWKEAKEKGAVKTVSRDYIMQDGDTIEFKI